MQHNAYVSSSHQLIIQLLVCCYTITIYTFQVGTNGIISFGLPFYLSSAVLFPGSFSDVTNTYVVAPFWSDVDIRSVGEIFYEVHSTGDSTRSDDLLASVSEFITNQTGNQFSGLWMLVAQWDEVPEYSFFGVYDEVNK